jgi:hypothetical protein
MRALAEFIMRGRVQATFVVVISAVLPLLFWLSAAAGSLVLLRRGSGRFIGHRLGLLPAMVWWYLGDPSTFWCCWGRWAWLVVARSSPEPVLLVSVVLGVLFSLVLDAVLRNRSAGQGA